MSSTLAARLAISPRNAATMISAASGRRTSAATARGKEPIFVGRLLQHALAPRDVGYGVAEAAASGGLCGSQGGRRSLQARHLARLDRLEDRVELLFQPTDRLDRLGSLDDDVLAGRSLGRAALADGVESGLEPRQRPFDRVVGDGGEALCQIAFELAQLAGQRGNVAVLLLAPDLSLLEQLRHGGERLLGAPLGARGATLHIGDRALQQVVAVVTLERATHTTIRAARVARHGQIVVGLLHVALRGRPLQPHPLVGPRPGASPAVVHCGTRAHLFQPRGHGLDPLLAANGAWRQAMILGMVGDHAVEPFAEGLALAPGGLACRLARIETDAVDVPGLGLAHRHSPAGADPDSSPRWARASRGVRGVRDVIRLTSVNLSRVE